MRFEARLMLSPKSENTDPLTDRYCIKKLGLYKILTEWLLRFLTVQERTALLPTRADTLWDEEEVSILSWPGRELEGVQGEQSLQCVQGEEGVQGVQGKQSAQCVQKVYKVHKVNQMYNV